MLQNERFGTGLKQYIPYATILDQSKTSDQYFRLFDVPEKLYVGKNSFRIRINKDTLVKGSLVYIDIVDSNGEIIFHEIADIIGEDGSRLIVVHIYEDTPPGEATIYIGSRASKDVTRNIPLPYSNDPSSTDYIDFPNIIWAGKVVVIPTNENENEIIFAKAPQIKVKERFETYKSYASTENRKMSVSGSFNVSITPTTTAYEYSDSSKSGNKVAENSIEVILDPSIDGNEATSRQKSIPQYAELTSLYDAGGNFTEDFKGGEIIIRNLTPQLNVAGVTVPDFSCSIVEVVDDYTVKVSPEFRFLYGEKNENVFRTIKNATNVTASYYTTKTQLQTFDSESFIQLNFENLEPIAGKVDSVAVSYKPYGSFGEFKPIGQFKIKPQEYLVDTENLVISKTELIERPIGRPSGSSEFSMYWDIIDGKYPAGAYTSGSFSNQGIYFKTDTTPISDKTYDYKLKVKNGYGINSVPNTEFKVSFTINLEEKRNSAEDFQLDVFISGSSVLRDTINDRNVTDLISDGSEGTRISSVTKQTTGAINTYTYYFKTISGGTIYPVFVIKNALVFSMKNISIEPRNEFGYSPNQAKLFIPIDTLKTNTELVLNIDYLTKKSERSKISSQVYGLFFSGSGLTPTVVDNGLGGSPVFIDVSQSISVQTIGTSLYSTNPLTSNFSTTNGIFLGSSAGSNANGAEASVFLGPEAGNNASNASFSNFIGRRAGQNATSAGNSNFLGPFAGQNATDAINSNFIGQEAGDAAANAAQSNFIGYQAGQNATNANDSNFLGYGAGNGATNANQSNFLGLQSGYAATEAIRSNFIGYNAGTSATNAAGSNFIGDQAGASATNAAGSNFIGTQAGYTATNASESVFLGHYAGVGSSEAFESNFIGSFAGVNATNAYQSNFIGDQAGYSAPSANNSNFIGYNSGYQAEFANGSNFIGVNSGKNSRLAQYSNFIGYDAGQNAFTASNSNFIGGNAGESAINASFSNFIGFSAGQGATHASSSIFIGTAAGTFAVSASTSILIGRGAGYTSLASNTIGSNNIIIGNGISLPIKSSYGLNIAGLIFGTGSYSFAGPNYTTFSGSANGRIGINQPNPKYSLDVSGSGNYTNNLYLTGGLLATQSYISTVDYIDFNQTAVSPFLTGRISWIDDTKTLNIDTDVNDVSIEVGHQNIVRARNVNSFTLTKGTIVYINGESGNRPTIATASWVDDSNSATTLGFVAADINSNQTGYIVTNGLLRGINTTAYAPGTMLYLSSSGQYTSTIPISPLHEVRLGRTITQAVNGTIHVNIMNGYEIGELHDVLINGKQNGDLIIWDSGSLVWKNSKILSGSYGISGSLNISQGITGSLIGTASFAVSASYYPIKVSGSTIYSADPATSGFNTTGAVLIGPNSVGQNSTNSQFAVMVGAAAGQNATTSQYAVMIGTSAGNGASNSEYAVMLGRWAGTSATNASSSVMVGRETGRNATNTTLSTFVGSYAGFTATNARNSTFIGYQAGYNATNANDSVFVGSNAGYAATAAVQSLFYGPNAGFQASAATLSTFIGNESGYNAISASYGVFIGNLSGQNATSASFSTFIGRQAGQAATKASSATFIGGVAGYAATFANNGTFIGNSAGESAVSASYSILIGNNAGATSNAANTIGSYNTVIGTGISVPRNATRALNIGGLIFGTGSYASPNLDAFSGSANGRVGINQPLPQREFDVSGSVRISNLATSLTAPVTSGTTRMVITDTNGDLSFTTIPTSGTSLQVTYITGSATQLRISSGSINTYYRISTTGAFEVAIPTNSSRPGIPTGSQIIIEKLITGSLILTAESGVGYTGSLYIPYQYQTLTLTKVNTDEWVGIGGYDNQIITFGSQSATTYTLVKEDIGEMIRLNNASPITVTIPPNSSEPFPIGAIVSLEQQGAGVVTCITGSGVTINSTARKTWGQYSVIQVYKVGTNTWNVIGGVE